MKRFLLLFVLCIAAVATFLLYKNAEEGGVNDSIAYIQRHINSRGQLVDMQEEISVNSVEDIKFFETKKNIEIEFGKVTLKWKRADFLTDDTKQRLQTIGLDYRYNEETDNIELYYYKQKVDKWVK